jgi:hypothetical protein
VRAGTDFARLNRGDASFLLDFGPTFAAYEIEDVASSGDYNGDGFLDVVLLDDPTTGPTTIEIYYGSPFPFDTTPDGTMTVMGGID